MNTPTTDGNRSSLRPTFEEEVREIAIRLSGGSYGPEYEKTVDSILKEFAGPKSHFSALTGCRGRRLRLPPLLHAVVLSLLVPSFYLLFMLVIVCLIEFHPYFEIWTSTDLGRLASYVIVGFLVATAICREMVVSRLLKLWKRREVNDRFSIAIFRPFHDLDASRVLRQVVAPIIGCYGQIQVVSDESYASAGFPLYHRNHLWGLEDVGDAPLSTDYSQDEWQVCVSNIISMSDLVVFYLPGKLTRNLLYELDAALTLLPSHRVLLLIPDFEDMPKEIPKLLDPIFSSPPWTVVPYGTGRLPWTRFRLRIFRAVQSIKQLDETVAANGSWRAPEKTVVGRVL